MLEARPRPITVAGIRRPLSQHAAASAPARAGLAANPGQFRVLRPLMSSDGAPAESGPENGGDAGIDGALNIHRQNATQRNRHGKGRRSYSGAVSVSSTAAMVDSAGLSDAGVERKPYHANIGAEFMHGLGGAARLYNVGSRLHRTMQDKEVERHQQLGEEWSPNHATARELAARRAEARSRLWRSVGRVFPETSGIDPLRRTRESRQVQVEALAQDASPNDAGLQLRHSASAPDPIVARMHHTSGLNGSHGVRSKQSRQGLRSTTSVERAGLLGGTTDQLASGTSVEAVPATYNAPNVTVDGDDYVLLGEPVAHTNGRPMTGTVPGGAARSPGMVHASSSPPLHQTPKYESPKEALRDLGGAKRYAAALLPPIDADVGGFFGVRQLPDGSRSPYAAPRYGHGGSGGAFGRINLRAIALEQSRPPTSLWSMAGEGDDARGDHGGDVCATMSLATADPAVGVTTYSGWSGEPRRAQSLPTCETIPSSKRPSSRSKATDGVAGQAGGGRQGPPGSPRPVHEVPHGGSTDLLADPTTVYGLQTTSVTTVGQSSHWSGVPSEGDLKGSPKARDLELLPTPKFADDASRSKYGGSSPHPRQSQAISPTSQPESLTETPPESRVEELTSSILVLAVTTSLSESTGSRGAVRTSPLRKPRVCSRPHRQGLTGGVKVASRDRLRSKPVGPVVGVGKQRRVARSRATL